ncbi:hypothetical protein CLG96_14295 [Sphingomonas oleivorans]|uniref:Uncharacterized protein n=1 Tax=Sphingomonas oleivorans TaxID=1735121 RepID=A0A2T5FWX2_9SPHN|nr:hypothetical protein [Sphingomonas oleivorans]PTQ10269.1 hypothetical protein CLG96_14295 [Sphingomonas oleivorans]
MPSADDRPEMQLTPEADMIAEWKHPLQTIQAYVEAVGRWSRHDPVNCDEIECALDGIEAALDQARLLLAHVRARQC